MKKTILGCLIGTYLIAGTGYAAPVTDVAKGDLVVDVGYSHLDTNVGDLKLDATEIGLTHGLSDKFALSTGVTFTGNETFTVNHNTYGPIEANIYDVKLQYKATKELAPFIGYKKWDIDYEGAPADVEIASQTGIQYGVIYNKKLTDKAGAFALVSFGNDIKEYKLGVTYDIQENCSAEINYRKISLDTHDKDLDAKGIGFGVTYKF